MKIRYIWHVIKTKGVLGSFHRLRQIIYRFGLSSSKSKHSLDIFINIMDEFGYTPTLCIVAILLIHSREIIYELISKKVDIAFHGYIHTNYTTLSLQKITDHLIKSKKLFKNYKIPFSGFRFPYLCWNEDILEIFRSSGFLWSSNHIIYWNALDRKMIEKEKWKSLQRVLNNLYVYRNNSHFLSLPKNKDGFVEIPVSIPDDEMIIDRLGIINEEEILKIWWKIFEESYKKGELFTLQLHHERVPFFQNALRSFLKKINNLKLNVWIASLKEIAEWWKEKNEFNLQIKIQKNNYYHIKADCSERATILVKKSNTRNLSTSLFNNYNIINNREFDIKCNKKPFIGIAENTPQQLIDFLREEGFIVEANLYKNNYALYFENYDTLNVDHEKDLKNIIEDTPYHLIRFWRWPNKAQSALSITLDIDGITLFDFLKRSLYF